MRKQVSGGFEAFLEFNKGIWKLQRELSGPMDTGILSIAGGLLLQIYLNLFFIYAGFREAIL